MTISSSSPTSTTKEEEMADHTGRTVPRTSISDEEEKEEESKDVIMDGSSNQNSMLQKALDASDVITSLRTVVEEQMEHMKEQVEHMTHIQPPMPYYTRPLQRQHWGDVQVAPHKEWGSVFFDLFYVAGAYNLGNMLREAPTVRGLGYFLAAFFSLQNLWQFKMYFDARFYVPNNDMFHNFYEMCTLVVLGTAVLYCRPVAILSHPEEHNDLFVFCSSLCIGMILVVGRSLEVLWMIEGGEESTGARVASKRDASLFSIIALVQAAAAIYAGVKFYSNNDGEYGADAYGSSSSSSQEGHYESDYHHGSSDHGYSSSHYDHHGNSTEHGYSYSDQHAAHHGGHAAHHGDDNDHHFRFLAGAGDSSSYEKESTYSGDVSMELLVAAYLANHLLMILIMMFLPRMIGHNDHKKITVPMNIDYSIHRYGEWTMLMLGESVLSLLIVGAQQEYNYYKTFYCGIISISLLQYMHFQSQPHHADDHAMRRKKERGYMYVVLVQIYSAALIILGASYKMLLYEFVYAAEYGASSGYGEEEASDNGHHRQRILLPALGAKLERLLAGGGGGALQFDTEDREQRIAHFFCGSMATIWFTCDMLILVHKGIKENMNRCQECELPKYVKILGIPLLLARVGLVVFMATLSQYQTDPSFLAFTGLVGIIAQVLLRVIGTSLYRQETEEDHVIEEIMRHGLKSQEFKLD